MMGFLRNKILDEVFNVLFIIFCFYFGFENALKSNPTELDRFLGILELGVGFMLTYTLIRKIIVYLRKKYKK